MKAQNSYLDALASNDVVRLRELYTKYSSKRRPNFETPTVSSFETPIGRSFGEETPVSVHQSVRTNATKSSSTSSTRSIADKHSLDSFLNKFTSEDDQSFEEIIEAAEEKLRTKFAILYEAEGESSNLLNGSLVLPSIENQFNNEERPNKLDTWTYKNKNYIMYIPDGVDFTQDEKIEMAKKKQEIHHGNTRLIANPFNDAQSKATISELAKNQIKNPDKIGLDGKTADESGGTPNIRGFSFVKSPSVCPSIVDSSPLMTWGEIEGTPFRLDAGDTPLRPTTGPSFRIAETSKREALAHELADRASEKHRAKKSRAIETAKRNMCASPQVRNSLQRLASMSPAAKRLTSSSGWSTPSPLVTNSNLTTPKQIRTPIIKINTPVRPQQSQHRSSSTESSLTDGLLSIPSSSKRSKAADFF